MIFVVKFSSGMSETFFDTCVNWSCVTRCRCRRQIFLQCKHKILGTDKRTYKKQILYNVIKFSVVDLHWFQCGRGFRMLGQCRVVMTKVIKFPAEKKFLIKNSIYLCLGFHEGCPSYMRKSLRATKENIQHCKSRKFQTVLYFCGSFFPS